MIGPLLDSRALRRQPGPLCVVLFHHNLSHRAKHRIRVIPCAINSPDAVAQSFFLTMSGHAGPIQIGFGVTPVVNRIP